MKRATVNIIAGSIIVCTLAGWTYYQELTNKQDQSREHGFGIKQLSCGDDINNLELSINGTRSWLRSHEELLGMASATDSRDRRFKEDKVMPLAALINEHPDITLVDIVPCDADSITLTAAEITEQPEAYILGRNRNGRMKLLRYVGTQRYDTVLRNVIALNLKP